MYAMTGWCMAALLVWSGLVIWTCQCSTHTYLLDSCLALQPASPSTVAAVCIQRNLTSCTQRHCQPKMCASTNKQHSSYNALDQDLLWLYYPYRVALQQWEPPSACSASSHRQHASLLLSHAQPTSAVAAGCHRYCVSLQHTALLPAQTICSCQAASINSLPTSSTSLVCCCSLSSTSCGVAAYNATTTQGSSLLLPRGVWACWQIP